MHGYGIGARHAIHSNAASIGAIDTFRICGGYGLLYLTARRANSLRHDVFYRKPGSRIGNDLRRHSAAFIEKWCGRTHKTYEPVVWIAFEGISRLDEGDPIFHVCFIW